MIKLVSLYGWKFTKLKTIGSVMTNYRLETLKLFSGRIDFFKDKNSREYYHIWISILLSVWKNINCDLK